MLSKRKRRSVFRNLPAAPNKNRPDGRQPSVYVTVLGRFRRVW